MKNLTVEDVHKRLCSLSFDVSELFEWGEEADCFCCQMAQQPEYLYSEKILKFIETAVREAIEKKKKSEAK